MSYSLEWVPAPFLLGALLLPVIAPSFALIALMVVALVALAAVVALAAALLASPYLLYRHLRGRSVSIARVIARTGRVTQQPRVAVLANPTTPRSSQ